MPTGFSATIGKFSRSFGEVRVTIDPNDMRQLAKNLGAVIQYMNIVGARAVAVVAIDLLGYTQPRVPWKTGELRRNGKAIFLGGRQGMIEVGKGRADGKVDADLGKLKANDFSKEDKVYSMVTYQRDNPKTGFDIAEWTHENIFAARSPKHPRARQFGTGPKYLENTFNSRRKKYIEFLLNVFQRKEFESGIEGATKIRNKRTGKFEVDVVEIVHGKIKEVGWRKSWNI